MKRSIALLFFSAFIPQRPIAQLEEKVITGKLRITK
jgi:hypothetical protein